MFQLPFLCPPTQHQVLNWAHVEGRGYCWCDPAIIRTKALPIFGRNLAGKGSGATTSAAFRQHLPLFLQSVVHIVVAAKAGVGAQNRALFLRLCELQKLVQSLEYRDIHRAAMLPARVQARE
jgi:hypothetical protein